MAAPNIVTVSNILGKSNVANITTVSSAVIVNPVNSNKVFKINTIIISNIDGVSVGSVSVDLFKFGAQNASTGVGNTTYAIANLISVPAKSSLDILSKTLYLEEGDQIRVKADSNNRLNFISSFEEIT